MNHADALIIANDWLGRIADSCEQSMIVGSVRRKKHDSHDVELMGKPILKSPTPVFGTLHTFATPLDKLLFETEQTGLIKKIKAGPKMKQFALRLEPYGLQSLNEFKLELYLITPPAQWGVGVVIRTGPASDEDHFSKWCVTNCSFGGALPDGYKVKHLAVWTVDQLDAKGEPKRGEVPLQMPRETDFLDFLGIGWIEPQYRHAPVRSR